MTIVVVSLIVACSKEVIISCWSLRTCVYLSPRRAHLAACKEPKRNQPEQVNEAWYKFFVWIMLSYLWFFLPSEVQWSSEIISVVISRFFHLLINELQIEIKSWKLLCISTITLVVLIDLLKSIPVCIANSISSFFTLGSPAKNYN